MALLSQLLARVRDIGSDEDCEIGAPKLDCLRVEKGDAFICLQGEKYDGHDFIGEAIRRGASAIICRKGTPKRFGTRFIEVDDTRLAAAHIFDMYSGEPSKKLRFVAVTGTNGKTSVSWILRHILRSAGINAELIGTVKSDPNSRDTMTTPPPERLYPMLAKYAERGVELVILEASSHALVQRRLDPIRFELAIFTNLSPEHLDYHSDMDRYFAAKSRLCEISDAILVNVDDRWMQRLRSRENALGFSLNGDGDFNAESIQMLGERVEYELSGTHVSCPIPGEIGAYNSLAAISAAKLFGVKPAYASESLSMLGNIPGRLERLGLREKYGFEVVIDYAHTPDALAKVLTVLRGEVDSSGESARLTVLFGCGGDRDSAKRPRMGEIASRLADRVIITSDNSRSESPEEIILDIMSGIPDGASRPEVIIDRDAAIRHAVTTAVPGELILLAGKGHEGYLIDSSGTHPFSERAIVFDSLNSRK